MLSLSYQYITYIFGFLLIIYGGLKTIIFVSILNLPNIKANIFKYPILKGLVGDDISLPGKVIDAVLLIFSILTFLRGSELVGRQLHLHNLVNTRKFIYWLYGILGVFLVTFFTFVLNSSLRIPKDERYITRYKFIGYCLSTTFIMTVPIQIMIHTIFDHGFLQSLKRHYILLFICLVTIVTLVLLLIKLITKIIKERDGNDKKLTWSDILTLFIIPLNAF
jgi:hypothetical protein